jgi:hypothetical protein
MKIKATVDYEKIKGLPEYNGKEIALLKSVDALSTYTTISQEDLRDEINLRKEVISNGEIEKYDRL